MPSALAQFPAISALAGHPAPKEMLVDVARLEREYYARQPELNDPTQLVSFGTSGHRGSPLDGTFTELHILAITQAICDYRRARETDGPLFMGKDTHAAALINDAFSARQGVEDDHLNIICVGGRTVGASVAWALVRTFLTAEFSQAERHPRRLEKVALLEQQGVGM